MSGGIPAAKNGQLTFMVGCDKENFAPINDLLFSMGKNVFFCGVPGNGGFTKLCNNLILGINMIALSEGLSLGEKLGLDSRLLSSIISASTGRSWCVDSYNPIPGIL